MEDYNLGKLIPAELELVAGHLEACSSCTDQLVQSESQVDGFMQQLRQPVSDELIADDSEMDRLVQMAAGLLDTSVDALAETIDEKGLVDKTAVEEICDQILDPPQAEDEIGRLGGYRVLAVLGAGGMGIVFKAEDPKLKRLVALKVMRPAIALTSKSAGKRFLIEAQATAAIQHDNVVTIHQVGEEGGVPFLAMQLLEGESLSGRLGREGTLPTTDTLRIGREIGTGLAAAHAKGLTHRDIKPDNIWLEANTGRVKILDFGLARATDGQAEVTEPGVILGTPTYLSPQQACGERVDHRADLFSLGVVLYRMTTGKSPFARSNMMASLNAVTFDNPAPPATLDETIPAALSDLVVKLMEKEPDQRCQTAEELIEQIRQIESVTAEPEESTSSPMPALAQAAPVSTTADGSWWSGHKKTIIAMVAAAVLLTAVVIYVKTDRGTLVIKAGSDFIVTADSQTVTIRDKKTDREFKVQVGKQKSLPSGDYLIRVEDNEGLEFDTTEFKIVRGGDEDLEVSLAPVTPPRVGTTKATSEPIVVADTKRGSGAPARWQPTPEQQAFFDAVAKLTLDKQIAAVRDRLKLINPDPSLKLEHQVEAGMVIELKISETALKHLWPIATFGTLKKLSADIGLYNEPLVKVVRGMKSLQEINGLPTAEFWKKFAGHKQEIEEFRHTAAAWSIKERLAFVRRKLMELNSGYDGKFKPTIEEGRLVGILMDTVKVGDLSPIRALPGLKRLDCYASQNILKRSRLADLSPLSGLKLTSLSCFYTYVGDLSPLQGMPLTNLDFHRTPVSDLSPLQGMPLADLNCEATFISDLSPLQGMKLTHLKCGINRVSDLSPLKGMPLTNLNCSRTAFSDLSLLQGMPLTYLDLFDSRVSDLSPLQGMKLTYLNCGGTGVTDLSPLKGMSLKSLIFYTTSVADLPPLGGMQITAMSFERTFVTDLSPLKGLIHLRQLECDVGLYNRANETLLKSLPITAMNYRSVTKYWEQYAARRKAAEEFMKSAAKLSGKNRIEAVRARIKARIKVGYPATTLEAKLDGEAVTEATLRLGGEQDLTPLMALTDLKKLSIRGGGVFFQDYSPLSFLPLEELLVTVLHARRNAPVLKEIKTLKTINGQPAAEFWKLISRAAETK